MSEQKLREALQDAIERMDRARSILATGPNWLMLDTTRLKLVLFSQPQTSDDTLEQPHAHKVVETVTTAGEPIKEFTSEDDVDAYINATPTLKSILYELDLLPGQYDRKYDTWEWSRIFNIANHWRAAFLQLERENAELRKRLRSHVVQLKPDKRA